MSRNYNNMNITVSVDMIVLHASALHLNVILTCAPLRSNPKLDSHISCTQNDSSPLSSPRVHRTRTSTPILEIALSSRERERCEIGLTLVSRLALRRSARRCRPLFLDFKQRGRVLALGFPAAAVPGRRNYMVLLVIRCRGC